MYLVATVKDSYEYHIPFLKRTLSIPDDKTEQDHLNYEAIKDMQIFVSLTCAKGFTVSILTVI